MSTPERILLDTHALVWWQAGSSRLSRPARRTIEAAHHVGISPISIFEIGILEAKGRISLDRPLRTWATDLLATPGIDLVDLDSDIAAIAATLEGFHGDPADRILYASAMSAHRPLITKDPRLRRRAKASGEITTIW